MSASEFKSKRRFWRPQFRVRTLVIVVTLVGVYLGVWEATKRFGVPTVGRQVADPYEGGLDVWSPAPLVIISEDNNQFVNVSRPHQFYLWVFGPKVRLSFTAEWEK